MENNRRGGDVEGEGCYALFFNEHFLMKRVKPYFTALRLSHLAL